MIHYGFSKSADLALMRGFAQALAASGVTVNAVLPGPTRTEGVEEMFKSMGRSVDNPEHQRAFIETGRPTSIIKRLTKPEEDGRGGRLPLLARSKRDHRLAVSRRWRRGPLADLTVLRGCAAGNDGAAMLRVGPS